MPRVSSLGGKARDLFWNPRYVSLALLKIHNSFWCIGFLEFGKIDHFSLLARYLWVTHTLNQLILTSIKSMTLTIIVLSGEPLNACNLLSRVQQALHHLPPQIFPFQKSNICSIMMAMAFHHQLLVIHHFDYPHHLCIIQHYQHHYHNKSLNLVVDYNLYQHLHNQHLLQNNINVKMHAKDILVCSK